MNSGLIASNINTLAISGTNIFAGTNGGGLFLQTNLTSINETCAENAPVNIYHNPVKNKIFIEIADHENTTAEIFNLEGQLLQTLALFSDETTVNVDYLATGVYFVKIKSPNGVTVQKLVKD